MSNIFLKPVVSGWPDLAVVARVGWLAWVFSRPKQAETTYYANVYEFFGWCLVGVGGLFCTPAISPLLTASAPFTTFKGRRLTGDLRLLIALRNVCVAGLWVCEPLVVPLFGDSPF